MKIRGFITHKQAESYSDCADYFAINRKLRKIAVSDGISQSFSPLEWSRILVQSYIEDKWVPGQDLRPLQSQWLEEVRANLNELQKQGAVTYMMENLIDERESAGATFCGISFDDSFQWNCIVLGDSALVKLSGNSIEIFSSQDGPFNNRPDYFDSYASHPVGKLKSIQGKLQKGDVLFVVSDPFSELFQKSIENKTDKQIIEKLLSVRDQDDFCSIVESLRTDFGMHNDDSTLVIIEYDGKEDFNDEKIIVLDELIKKEQQTTEQSKSMFETKPNETYNHEAVRESESDAAVQLYSLESIRRTAMSVFFRISDNLTPRSINKVFGKANKKMLRKEKDLRRKMMMIFDAFWNEFIKDLKS